MPFPILNNIQSNIHKTYAMKIKGVGDISNRDPQIIVHGGLYNERIEKKNLVKLYMEKIKEAAQKGHELLKVSEM